MEEVPKIQLPKWLDDLIFKDLGAKYCRQNANMTNIDDDKERALNYLGTYFPRSYAEAYILFSALFEEERQSFIGKNELSVFDFGCGTGGEIIGLLTAIEEKLPNIKKVTIDGFDGNQISLRYCDNIVNKFRNNKSLQVVFYPIPKKIDDFYDFSVINSTLSENYDLIITFKAICEFVTKQQFEQKNPYEYIVDNLLRKLQSNGFMVLVDVTVYSNVTEQWLPNMMDKGLKASQGVVINKNQQYNQAIYVSHSHKENDISKIAWRIITQ